MTEDSPNKSFPERIKALVDFFGSKEKLAKVCGISAVMIGKYESGQSEPSREKLISMAEAAEVSVEWLVTGNGPMLQGDWEHIMELAKLYMEEGKDEDVQVLHLPGNHDLSFVQAPGRAGRRRTDDKYCYIPLYNVRASAGGGAVVDRENVVDNLAFKSEWIRTHLNATQQDLYLIHVEGESMEPTLRPGDVILIDHREAEKLPRDGIYVVRMEDSLLVKRLQRMPGGNVLVTSDNPAYQPFTVSLAQERHEMEIVGRVVWCGRRM